MTPCKKKAAAIAIRETRIVRNKPPRIENAPRLMMAQIFGDPIYGGPNF
jgi:hypothetical protein